MVSWACSASEGFDKADSRTDRTTLSPFLSIKSLASHLDCRGPSFTLDVIQSISYILHRLCPSEAAIIQGCKAVQNTEDDFWPSNGEEDPEENGAAWDSTDGTKGHCTHQQAFKRRRVGLDERPERPLPNQLSPSTSNITGYSVTMQNATTFSVSSTSIHSGFTSAGAHLQDLAQRKTGRATEIDEDTFSPIRSTGNKKNIASIKHNRNEELTRPRHGQGTLMHFFAPFTKSGDTLKENPVRETSPPQLLASRQHGMLPKSPDVARPFSQSREPMLPIPQPLAAHRLRSAPIPTRPPNIPQGPEIKHYPFFSSSPPPAESLIEEAEAGGTNVSEVDRSHKRDRTEAISQGFDGRLATTFHVTTTTQVRYAQVTTKTLGVRRSMNGWTNRGGRSFSVPGRTKGR